MICGAIYLFPRLFGGGDTVTPTAIPRDTTSDGGNAGASSTSSDINLGSLVIAENIDRDGCAVDNNSSLRNTNQFYVIAPNSAFPAGTTIFARLYRDGVVVEDLPLITADQDYSSSCVNFVFETVNANNFETGQYEAEFWVNGNSYNSISFNIN
jgi:hypothetical protein